MPIVGLIVGLVDLPLLGHAVGPVDLMNLPALSLVHRYSVDLSNVDLFPIGLTLAGQTDQLQDVGGAALF